MEKMKLFVAVLLAMGLFSGSGLALAADTAGPSEKNGSHHKFSIGFRVKSWELTGNKNFVGSIVASEVKEDRSNILNNLNLQVLFCDYAGLIAEFDSFEAFMSDDGHLKWKTITLGFTLRYPIKKRFVPYGVLGLTYNRVSFQEERWWHYGFETVDQYYDYMRQRPWNVGAREWRDQFRGGYRRIFQTDDAFGWTYGLGLDVFITENLAINLDARWQRAQTHVKFILANERGQDPIRISEFDYDLDTFSIGLGLRWYF
ncbi:MAG: outer membrane beta-barrel protein [Desulfarculaceae bacterium]|jgi:opacity protein-like surface antigen